ncbi:hypothetical protein [Singulisphaera sp. PoT]|uniref:hypothetical protein n=1 Tax=Singulisphaera sp. PoT TaxID=3411797 RepID=UPI003BF5AA95
MEIDYVFLAWGLMLVVASAVQFFFPEAVLASNRRVVPRASYDMINRVVPFKPRVLRAISVVELILGIAFLILAFA